MNNNVPDLREQLEKQLKLATNKEVKSEIHNQLGVIWNKLHNPKKSLFHHKEELKNSPSSSMFIALRFIAEAYRNLNKLNKSIAYNQQHIELAIKENSKLELHRGYCNLGIAYLKKGESFLKKDIEDKSIEYIDLAINSFHKSLNILDELIEDQKKAILTPDKADKQKKQVFEKLLISRNEALYSIGDAYSIKSQHDEKYRKDAIDYLELALESSKKTHDEPTLGKCYHGLGLLYMQMKEYNQSEVYLKKDEEICRKRNDYELLVITIRNLGRLYHLLRKYELAKQTFEEAKRICVEHLNSIDKNIINEEMNNLKVEIEINQKANLLIDQITSYENSIMSSNLRLYSNSDMILNNTTIKKYIKLNEELHDILIEKLEDYEKCKMYINKFLNKIMELSIQQHLSQTSQNLNIKINNEIKGKCYYLLGICEDNLKNFNQAKLHFENAIELLKPSNIHQAPNKHYLNLLIDYANCLDNIKEYAKDVEKLYWDTYNLALKIKNNNVIKISLNNLDYLYKKNKNIIQANKVNKLLQEYKEDNNLTEEQSDISNDSLNLDRDDYAILGTIEEKLNEFDSPKAIKATSGIKLSNIEYNNEIEIEYKPHVMKKSHGNNTENEKEHCTLSRNSESKTIVSVGIGKNTNSNTIMAQKPREIMNEQIQMPVIVAHNPQEIYNDLITKHHMCKMKVVNDQLNSCIFDMRNQYLSDINIKIILKSLRYNDQIQEINMKNNRASSKSIKSWNQMFKCPDDENHLTNLIKLNFSANPFNTNQKNDNVGHDDFEIFLYTLSHLKILQYLNLSNIILSSNNQEMLFKSLNSCHELLILKLKNCCINDMQQYHPYKLEVLNLKNNQLNEISFENLLIRDLYNNLMCLNISNQRGHYDYSSLLNNEMSTENNQYVDNPYRDFHLEKLKMCNNDLNNMSKLSINLIFHKLMQSLIILDISGCKNLHEMFQYVVDNAIRDKIIGNNVQFKLRKLIYKNGDLTLPKEITTLSKFLSLLQYLEKLDLSNTKIDSHDQVILLDNLTQFNLNLQKLILQNWQISQDLIDQLWHSLHYLNTLYL